MHNIIATVNPLYADKGETIEVAITNKQADGTLVDLTTSLIQIYSPEALLLSSGASVKASTGVYQYQYTLADDCTSGGYRVIVTVTNGTEKQIKKIGFTVKGTSTPLTDLPGLDENGHLDVAFLRASGEEDGDILYFSEVDEAWKVTDAISIITGVPTLEANLDINHKYLVNTREIIGGSTYGGKGAILIMGNQTQGDDTILYSPNAIHSADVERLRISGGLATAVATWSNITHSGLKLGGGLDCNGQSILYPDDIQVKGESNRLIYLRSLGGTNKIDSYDYPITETVPMDINASVLSLYAGDVLRLSINSATGIATWSNVTHTGLNADYIALTLNQPTIRNIVDNSYLTLCGGGDVHGASIALSGKTREGLPGKLEMFTPSATLGQTYRMGITGGADIAVIDFNNCYIDFDYLPTADPHHAGRLFVDGVTTDLRVSRG